MIGHLPDRRQPDPRKGVSLHGLSLAAIRRESERAGAAQPYLLEWGQDVPMTAWDCKSQPRLFPISPIQKGRDRFAYASLRLCGLRIAVCLRRWKLLGHFRAVRVDRRTWAWS